MKTAIEMAAEAGFNIDMPVFKDGTAIALKLIEIAQREEREACAKVCESFPAWSDGAMFAEAIRTRDTA